jgi:hypothetical protein
MRMLLVVLDVQQPADLDRIVDQDAVAAPEMGALGAVHAVRYQPKRDEVTDVTRRL